jgi:hypothetical protein
MKIRKAIGLAALVAASAAAGETGSLAAGGAPAAATAPQASDMILAPFSDHFTIRVEKPADIVWRHIKRLYVDGERMRQQGFAVSPVTDPAAWLGGVRGVHPSNTARPEVTILVSGVDEKERLLTLMISLENPVPVFATHRVRPDGPNAAIYETIVQTRWPVKKPEGGALTPDYVREKMKADVAFHNSEVAAIMKREKAVIEALD